MKKLAFIDIGELGWSMYVNAHIRWLKQKGNVSIVVITYPDRQCLYEGLADIVTEVPKEFCRLFDIRKQNCLGLQSILPEYLRKYFIPYLPKGYNIPEDFIIGCKFRFGDRLMFEPYKYSEKLEGRREVLIFPRHRLGGWYSYRNLGESFYVKLIKRLCDEFPDLNIRTIGTTMGAYNIVLDKPNYVNYVGKGNGLQDMIDHCQLAVAAVGSQSGPPKIALLQGVPTFMIGNQKNRHMVNENWSKTRAEFVEVKNNDYAGFVDNKCIDQVVDFVKIGERVE